MHILLYAHASEKYNEILMAVVFWYQMWKTMWLSGQRFNTTKRSRKQKITFVPSMCESLSSFVRGAKSIRSHLSDDYLNDLNDLSDLNGLNSTSVHIDC